MKLSVTVTFIKLCKFIPCLVTLTHFEGHRRIGTKSWKSYFPVLSVSQLSSFSCSFCNFIQAVLVLPSLANHLHELNVVCISLMFNNFEQYIYKLFKFQIMIVSEICVIHLSVCVLFASLHCLDRKRNTEMWLSFWSCQGLFKFLWLYVPLLGLCFCCIVQCMYLLVSLSSCASFSVYSCSSVVF